MIFVYFHILVHGISGKRPLEIDISAAKWLTLEGILSFLDMLPTTIYNFLNMVQVLLKQNLNL